MDRLAQFTLTTFAAFKLTEYDSIHLEVPRPGPAAPRNASFDFAQERPAALAPRKIFSRRYPGLPPETRTLAAHGEVLAC